VKTITRAYHSQFCLIPGPHPEHRMYGVRRYYSNRPSVACWCMGWSAGQVGAGPGMLVGNAKPVTAKEDGQ
jgi:hypothetical protein